MKLMVHDDIILKEFQSVVQWGISHSGRYVCCFERWYVARAMCSPPAVLLFSWV